MEAVLCNNQQSAALCTVLAHDNAAVRRKFRSLYSLSEEESRAVFSEMLKWLWLCCSKEHARDEVVRTMRQFVIHESMVILDEMWHVFILHTREYEAFCMEHFGRFIHHSPGTPGFSPFSEQDVRLQLGYIAEVLGEDTLRTWYVDYAVQYSPDRLQAMIKPRVFGRPCEAA